jgi:prepilin-type N-terminal cleavage/methylation domain-containing protein
MSHLTRRHSRHDGGYSLVELLVAMAVASTVLGLVTSAMIAMLHNGAAANSRLANLDQIRIGVDALSKNLRTAIRPEQLNPTCSASCSSAFDTATGSQVVFYANVGDKVGTKAAPTRITYSIAADPNDTTGHTASVTETRQHVAPTWTTGDYSWSAGTTRVVSRGITWPLPSSNGPLFTYYNGSNAALAAPSGSTLAQIASIRIALPVGDAAHPSPGVSTSVFLPNSTLGH